MSDPTRFEDDRRPTLTRVRAERERVITALCDGYAADLFDDHELERRMDLAHRASSVAELEVLRADLPLPVVPAPSPPTTTALAVSRGGAAATRKAEQRVLAIFGQANRRGPWTPAAVVKTRAVFGNIVLDFREASLLPGVTRVEVHAVFGNIELYVPPGLAVETEGLGIFGNFAHLDRAPAVPEPDAPLLRIVGNAIFGNVEVKTRLPGESDWQAWRRRRRELRAARRE